MDSFAFKEYLRAAREHGKHDYQAGRKFWPEQYVCEHLRAAYKDGYNQEHEKESELI